MNIKTAISAIRAAGIQARLIPAEDETVDDDIQLMGDENINVQIAATRDGLRFTGTFAAGNGEEFAVRFGPERIDPVDAARDAIAMSIATLAHSPEEQALTGYGPEGPAPDNTEPVEAATWHEAVRVNAFHDEHGEAWTVVEHAGLINEAYTGRLFSSQEDAERHIAEMYSPDQRTHYGIDTPHWDRAAETWTYDH